MSNITHVEVWMSEAGVVAGTDDYEQFIHRSVTPDIVLAGKTATYWVWVVGLLYAPTRHQIIKWCAAHHAGTLKRIHINLSLL